jgi:hypothetical protein
LKGWCCGRRWRWLRGFGFEWGGRRSRLRFRGRRKGLGVEGKGYGKKGVEGGKGPEG